jgi:hypothetical protein
VLGRELNPAESVQLTPSDESEAAVGDAEIAAQVYQMQSAHEIWARLADEYGAVSELRRAQAEASFIHC